MTPPLEKWLAEVEKRSELATDEPWVDGYWTIHDCDREAQKRKEPYWTLEPNGWNDHIIKGPHKRKALEPEHIVCGNGHDSDDLWCRKEDFDFITHSRTDLPLLVKLLRKCREQRESMDECSKMTAHFDNELAQIISDTLGAES